VQCVTEVYRFRRKFRFWEKSYGTDQRDAQIKNTFEIVNKRFFIDVIHIVFTQWSFAIVFTRIYACFKKNTITLNVLYGDGGHRRFQFTSITTDFCFIGFEGFDLQVFY